MADSDDEPITLSSNALEALQEFYSERDARAKQFEQLKVEAEEKGDATPDPFALESALKYPLSMETFGEDWNKSQFWYSDDTANLFAKKLLDGATAETRIAVVSTPSVFVALKNILVIQPPGTPKPIMTLLEHDYRFNVFSEFVFYDFMQPVKLPQHLKGAIDRFIIDPPFLSADCQTKMALTVRWLAKGKSRPEPAPLDADDDMAATPGWDASRVIVCTGERLEPLVNKLYRPLGLQTTDYVPVHRGLSNDFNCHANFECAEWKWKAEEE